MVILFVAILWSLCAYSQEVIFSKERSFQNAPFTLVLSSDIPNAIIRYTTDGTKPSFTQGIIYNPANPLYITTTSYVRAFAYANVNVFSDVQTHSYIFVNDVINAPEMDPDITTDPAYSAQMSDALTSIPSISIVSSDVTSNNPINSEVETSVELIFPDGTPGFQVRGGIQTWGGSPTNPKKHYRLEFKSIYGTPVLNYPLFDNEVWPISPTREFNKLLLRGGSQDGLNAEFGSEKRALFIRNRVVFDMQMEMGYPAPHGRWTHVYVNGEYMGHYHLTERPSEKYWSSYHGDEKENWEVYKSGQYWNQPVTPTFFNQMQSYLDTMYNYTTTTQRDNVLQYLDLDRTADFLVLNQYIGNFDWGYSHNCMGAALPGPGNGGYLYSIWDVDLTLGNEGGFESFYGDLTYYNSTSRYGPVSNELYQSSTEFKVLMGDRLECHCSEDGLLTPDKVDSMLTKRANEVDKSLIAESARWGDESFTHHRHDSVVLWDVNDEWTTELNDVRNGFAQKRDSLMFVFYRQRGTYPANLDGIKFNQKGGEVPAGFNVILTNPNAAGTIYYTINGDDPRNIGGSVNASALTATSGSPIALPSGVAIVKARVKNGTEWSAMCPVRFYQIQNTTNLVINEIHYNPGQSCGVDSTEFEFIELHNHGTTDVNLTGFRLIDGVRYSFKDGDVIAGDSYIVIAENIDSFTTKYGFPPDGQYIGSLSNGGEKIVLIDQEDRVVDQVTYGDNFPWDELPDGNGPSLELVDPTTDNDTSSNWVHSIYNCGSPNAENSAYCSLTPAAIVINEINYAHNAAIDIIDAGDWVELYNPTNIFQDISGWRLQDSDTTYVIPPSSFISPNGFMLIVREPGKFSATHPGIGNVKGPFTFNIRSSGESLVLRDATGCVVDRVEFTNVAPWPQNLSTNGITLSLTNPVLDNLDPASWSGSVQLGGSPGAVNDFTACQNVNEPNLVINELNYKSPLSPDAGDWVEIHNPNTNTVNVSGWEFHDNGNHFKIPNGTSISPDGFLILAQDGGKFTQVHPGEPYLAPLGFGLDGDGEQLAIVNDNRCVIVDEVKYNDAAPWDTLPDGNGPTLALIAPNLDNSFAGNWVESNWGNAPQGTPNAHNNIPDPCNPTPPQIVINEIYYNSVGQGNDWIELHNTTSQPLILANWTIYNNDTSFVLPGGTTIVANGYLIISENQSNFASQYPGVSNVIGSSTFDLSEIGERLMLYNPTQCMVDSVDYNINSPWPQDAAQENLPISLIDPLTNNAEGWNWITSTATPGATNSLDCGPGNISSSLRMWLRADEVGGIIGNGLPIASWSDKSNTGNNATVPATANQPKWQQSELNFNPTVRFDGIDDWMKINGVTSTLADTSVVYVVVKPDVLTNDGYYLSTHLGGSNRIKFGNNPAGRMIYDDDVPSIDNINHFGDPSIVGLEIFQDRVYGSVSGVMGTPWTTFLYVTGADRASIGQEYDGSGADNQTSNHWKGDLAEMIVFEGSLNTSQRHQIETYLNIRYGIHIPIANHLFFNHSGHDNRIAGIGSNPAQCLDQIKSTSQEPEAILTLNAEAVLSPGSYLVWGDDANSLTEISTDIPSPITFKRLNRSWKANEVAETGLTTLSFDLTGTGISLTGRQVGVLIDSDDGLFANAQLFYATATVSGNIATITGVDINDGDWFTLATDVRPNNQPIAVDDAYPVDEDATLNADVSVNDSDPDADNLIYSGVPITPPTNGTLTINPNGTFTYDPNPNFNGTDYFVYEVCDDGAYVLCQTAKVNITINAINDAPVATNDTKTINEDVASTTVNVKANDTDVDGTPTTVTIVTGPSAAQGTASVNGSNNIVFSPAQDYNGTVVITYEICDNGTPLPAACDQATLTITVNAVNDAPVANNDTRTINEDASTYTVNVKSNDTDVDGTPSTVSIVTGPSAAQGVATVNGSGNVVFTPAQDYNGTVVITYEVCDNGTPLPAACDQATLTITVNPINDAPVAANDTRTINEDASAIAINVKSNDSDIDGTPTAVSIVTGPSAAQGTASVNGSNNIVFTPTPNYNGTVVIAYQICDNG